MIFAPRAEKPWSSSFVESFQVQYRYDIKPHLKEISLAEVQELEAEIARVR